MRNLDTLTTGAADAFVFRRVSTDRFAHLGGVGQGERWAGIVTVLAAHVDDPLPGPGEVLTITSDDLQRRFGSYRSRFLVLARLDHELVVAFGGPVAVDRPPQQWLLAAREVAAQVIDVAPASGLADELEMLHAVRDVALIPPGAADEVATQLIQRLSRALRCEISGLLLPDGDLLVHVSPGAGLDEGLVRLALRSLLQQHKGEEPVCVQDATGSIEGSWLRCYMIRSVGDQGVLVLGRSETSPRGFTELCNTLAASATVAAETVLLAAAQFEAVRHRAARATAEARSDALTGLGNRRAWNEAVAMHEREGPDDPVAVVACDLDGLKRVNDVYGHAAGDRYLQAAADVLRGVVRDDDLAVRMGGDEFVLLLPRADMDLARAVATRIAHACRSATVPDGHAVALSVGVAVGHGAQLTRLLAEADEAMYVHKQDARRDVLAASPDTTGDAAPALEPIVGIEAVQPVVGEILRVLLQLSPEAVDDGIQQSLAALGRALDMDRAYLFSTDDTTFHNTHEWCAPGISPEIDNLQDLSLELIGGWLPSFHAGEPVAVTSVADMPDEQVELRALLQSQDVQSLLMVPMTVEDLLVGFIGFDAVRAPRTFGRVAQGLLRSVADVIAAVIARREADRRAARAEARTNELLRHTRDHVFLLNDGIVSWASDSFRQLGMDPEDIVGTRGGLLPHEEDAERVNALVEAWLRTSTEHDLLLPDHRVRIGDEIRWMSVVLRDARSRPGIEGLVVSAHDVTERRDQSERLRHRTLHDQLTGLPNRALLTDRLGIALHRVARYGGQVGALFLDLDAFKVINDSRSHAVGDALLAQVGDRLGSEVRNGETAARFGADQFVVVIEAETDEQVRAAAHRIATIFEVPFLVGGETQKMSASFGLRIANAGEVDPDAVLQDADTALFAAKARGRGQLMVFEHGMRERAVRQNELVRRLPLAIEEGEVRPHYQPIVDLATGRPIGAEALARWTHPELGEVSPTEFIPVAEQAGLIGRLGEAILRRACQDAMTWRGGYVSVNLSPSQIDDEALCLMVTRALEDSGLPPDRLLVEVTESLAMRDSTRAAEHLHQLRSTGVRVALDDFGTGHSSLAVLRDLPLDIVKIDRAFIARLSDDERGARMVTGIVRLAHDIGLHTVAEGVETAEQAARLRTAGCPTAQGWLFGAAVPGSDLDLA